MYKGLFFLDYGHVEGSPTESLTEKCLDLPFDLETYPCMELCRGGGLVKDDIGSTVPPTPRGCLQAVLSLASSYWE